MLNFTIILLLSQFFCVMGNNDISNCLKLCELVYKQICATIEDTEGNPIDCTFANDCILEMFTCINGKKEIGQKPGFCPALPLECNDIILGTLSKLEFLNPDNDKSNCLKACPLDIIQPICVTIENSNGEPMECTFPGDCYFEVFMCLSGTE
ncbi:hypothetical protein FF38_02052, partial [Lucilia cuprina]